jgi:hypothetical protein
MTSQRQHGKFSEFWSFMGSTATTKVYSPPSLFHSLFLCYFVSANRGKWAHQWAYEKKEKISSLSEIEIAI